MTCENVGIKIQGTFLCCLYHGSECTEMYLVFLFRPVIAAMMNCEKLIILSNIDGIYNGNPADKQSKVIDKVLPRNPLDISNRQY